MLFYEIKFYFPNPQSIKIRVSRDDFRAVHTSKKTLSMWLANKRMNTLSKAARLSLSLEQNAN